MQSALVETPLVEGARVTLKVGQQADVFSIGGTEYIRGEVCSPLGMHFHFV